MDLNLERAPLQVQALMILLAVSLASACEAASAELDQALSKQPPNWMPRLCFLLRRVVVAVFFVGATLSWHLCRAGPPVDPDKAVALASPWRYNGYDPTASIGGRELGNGGSLPTVPRPWRERNMTFRGPLLAGVLFCAAALAASASAQPGLDAVRPVVVKTVPTAGAEDVDPALTEIAAIFSKDMMAGSWSWNMEDKDSFPALAGEPKCLPDKRTCVLPVKLEPNKVYRIWINAEKHLNFKDSQGRSALPYLLAFKTKK